MEFDGGQTEKNNQDQHKCKGMHGTVQASASQNPFTQRPISHGEQEEEVYNAQGPKRPCMEAVRVNEKFLRALTGSGKNIEKVIEYFTGTRMLCQTDGIKADLNDALLILTAEKEENIAVAKEFMAILTMHEIKTDNICPECCRKSKMGSSMETMPSTSSVQQYWNQILKKPKDG
ncbi:hypothetical protein TTRE_0000785201 [Trichuris trichiura]|uniref:Uncharacterized protein n=1 Tax=Trichuris trichiura TaxID=36087 RepID=A0A077ZGN7_TRITR|nr:hypothetical protein TTRE_0000785201 [Trichuris trichiura]